MDTRNSFQLRECVCLVALLCVFQLLVIAPVVAGDFAVFEVSDVNPGVAGSNPEWLTLYDDELFFSAIGSDGVNWLHKTDGVTMTQFDVRQGHYRHYPSWLTPFQGELYFSGGRGKLYKADGKTVVEIPRLDADGARYCCSEFLTPFGDELFFRSLTPERYELFKTDGETVTGLGIDMPLHIHLARERKPLIVPFGDELFYTSIAANGWELFKTDGHVVTELADINPGPADSTPYALTPFRGELFFSATGPEGNELYKTDGTTVTLVADINPGMTYRDEPASSYPYELTEFGGKLFFAAMGPNGTELYQTDGTTVGQVADIYTGPSSSAPAVFTPVGDQMFFSATGPFGREPFKTDGATVTRLGDVNPGRSDSSPEWFTPFAGEVFFSANGPNGRELYRTNGDAVVEVADINPGAVDSNPEWLTVYDGDLYFSAAGSNGRELYKVVSEPNGGVGVLQPGDADQDFDFDQLDLLMVQSAAKYLTGQPATWGEGDWNGAPGGSAGSPPPGDGVFNQLDIVSAQQAGIYSSGPYAAIRSAGEEGDRQVSIVYDAVTGELSLEVPPQRSLTSIYIESEAGIFTGDPAKNVFTDFGSDTDHVIQHVLFVNSFGSQSFGNVAQAGLTEEFILNDLTVIGSLAGGGDLGDVDLIYVPEPSSVVLLFLALLFSCAHLRRTDADSLSS